MFILLLLRTVRMIFLDEIFFARYTWNVYRGKSGECPWWELYTGTLLMDLMLFILIAICSTVVLMAVAPIVDYFLMPFSLRLVLLLGFGIPGAVYISWLIFWFTFDFYMSFQKVRRDEMWEHFYFSGPRF